jgi:hypothetical protein
MEKPMTINPEIFWSVLTALFAYGISKHLLGVVLGQLFGKQSVAATNHQTGRSSAQKDAAV